MRTLPPVLVENPRRGWLARWLVGPCLMLSAAVVLAAPLVAVGTYAHFAHDLPAPPGLDDPPPPGATRFLAHDGRLLAEFGLERRAVVPLERLPRHLIEAFLAAEDQRFFDHDGVDLRATVRALLSNLRRGRDTQGASTLTQQLCKDRVGRARSYRRKAREAILARRTETRLSKLDILGLYLNRIYLGQGAYGVQAAARTYFQKDVEHLSLAEAALLAGLPPQPGRLNPVLDPEGSKARQAYVLDRMVAAGFLDPAAAEAARLAPLAVVSRRPDHFNARAPAYTEHARQDVQRRLGYHRVHREGLTVSLAVDADLQSAAQAALGQGLMALGERQGYVGPERRLEGVALAAAQARAEVHYAQLERLEQGRLYVGLVDSVSPEVAEVRVGPLRTVLTRLGGAAWARPYTAGSGRAESNTGRALADLRTALAVGDVIWVRALPGGTAPPDADAPPEVALAQPPPVEGALVAIEPDSGRVAAMVGGFDFDRSEYNRAFQGCRQPGSVFKPLVYSLALDRDYTLATTLADTPVAIFDQGASFLWKPRNLGGKFAGEVLLYEALARSLNLPAVRTLLHVGAKAAAAWATGLGLRTPMPAEPSLVLGSACVHPWDMVQVYATFAERGQAPRTHFVKRIVDQSGRILEDRTHVSDAWAPALARLDGLLRAVYAPRPRRLSEETAYLLQAALQGVIEVGTAQAARLPGQFVAGKTGTTDAFDAWFVGFTRHLVAGVWIGSDRNTRRLGAGETGGTVALPVWHSVMAAGHQGKPPRPLLEPVPAGVVWLAVDPLSGLRAAPGGRALRLPFKRGTEPDRVADRPTGPGGGDDRDLLEGRF